MQPGSLTCTRSKETTISVKLNNIKELEEVIVMGTRSEIVVHGTQMSAIEVPVAQIKNIPARAGEVDVIKAIQLLAGVPSGTEGSTGLYVRGGGPDQNLILLDGIPLYNINHMMGFFSVFNADAIKSVTLYKGSFPARFGSRLSSVIDVSQNDGTDKRYHGLISVGLLSARLSFEGPIHKKQNTVNYAARRTYIDALAQPIIAMMARSEGMDRMMAGYYFYDLNAKVSHKFSDKDRLSATFYMGDDALYANMKDTYKEVDYTTTDKMKTSWAWGNIVAMINWNHQFNSKLFANTFVAYTRYRFSIDMMNEEKTEATALGDKEDNEYYKFDMGYHSSVDDWSVNTHFDWMPHPNHDVKFGGMYTFHTFRPAVSTSGYKYGSSEITYDVDTILANQPLYSHEAAIFIEDNWRISNIVKVNIGLRGSLYAVTEKVYPSIEPRVSVRVLAMKELSFKASYSYITQYIHLLSNSNLMLPTDLWVPVTKRIQPMQSNQVAVGAFYNLLDQLDISLEAYYKSMNNLIEYKDGASFMGSTTGWEDKVVMGRGWSYGIEVLLQRKIGKFTGWIGYTWSKSQRKFDRKGQEINFGRPFYAKYDRRHDLSITASYAVNKKVDVAATFIYGTGVCGTLGTQMYELPMESSYSYYSYPVEYIPERNNFRMPDYHRLDIGCNFYRYPKVGKSIWNISIYNVYNRLNPFMVYVGTSDRKSVV